MFRKLLGGAAAGLNFGGERKICITDSILEGNRTSSPSPCLYSSSTTSSTTTTTNSTASANSENKNLRCPRCDSSNTKFCYYNNYNLTQPRHFCKTCRRYWTKGGVLRNVPIGGGCRKSKNTTVSTSVGKSSAGKMKKVVSEIGRSGLGNRFDHDLQSTPILWDSPQSSHLLASLRTNQNPNPNTLSNTVSIKEEVSLLGPRVMNEAAVATSALNARTLGLEPLKQVPSLGLCSSFWENNQHQAQQRQQNNNGFLVGEVQNPGIQELYQSLKSSSPYISDSSAVVISNLGSSSSFSSSSILESAPVTGGELGYWNPAFSSSWSDLPTTNGEYP